MEKYYIVVNGEKKGPYALSQLRKMWDSGAITMDAKYIAEGMADWADIGPLMEEENSLRKPVSLLPAKSTSSPPSGQRVDEVIYADKLFVISRTSFVTPGQTFLMRNITSVRTVKTNWGRNISIFIFVFLVALALDSNGIKGETGGVIAWSVGVIATIAFIIFSKPTYWLYLVTSAGEIGAHISKDERYMNKLVAAIHKAISIQ